MEVVKTIGSAGGHSQTLRPHPRRGCRAVPSGHRRTAGRPDSSPACINPQAAAGLGDRSTIRSREARLAHADERASLRTHGRLTRYG
jgi:hypothetical protein